jgi:hypothetical protein
MIGKYYEDCSITLGAPPNNSFNPTLASESFMLKLSDSCYVVAVALASGGLIRAFGG